DRTGTSLSPVALVNYDSQAGLDFLLPFITQADAAGSFSFLMMEETEAMSALSDGTVCAVLILPEHMLSGILDSTNIPARLYLPEADSFPSLLLGKFAEAGALTLGASQAGIYAASDLYREYGIQNHLSDIYYDINLVNLKYVLARESAFSARSVTATGELSLTEYYGCTAFLCVLLFFGAGMGEFLCNASSGALSARLKQHGTGAFLLEASLFLPRVLFYLTAAFFLTLAASFLLPELSLSPAALWFLFCVVLCLAAYTQFVFRLLGNAGRGLLAFSFFGLLMLFLAGGFLPYAFLPAAFHKLTRFVPLGSCLTGLRRLAGNAVTLQDSLPVLLHAAVLLLLLALLCCFRRKEVHA
ncbi:MAG: ABC transporter permease, partial [Lachnospiraceae bacterium]